MYVRALTIVVIVAFEFYDCMHCTSMHVVIAIRMCPASSESEVMVVQRGRSGSGLFGLPASCGELGMGGYEHGQRFSLLVRAPNLLPIPGSGHGYCRDDDT